MKHRRTGKTLSSVFAATCVITLAAVLAGLKFPGCSVRFVLGKCGVLARPEVKILRCATAGQKAPFECWVDYRSGRFKQPNASPFASVMLAECPNVRDSLLELVNTVKQSFRSSSVALPRKKFVEGVLLDDEFGKEALVQLQNLDVPVYTSSRSIEGEKLPDNAAFVCNAEDGIPFAINVRTQVVISSRQRQPAENIYALAVEDADEKAARDKEDEEEMARYKEGLADASKYVLPPRKRMNQIFGFAQNRGAPVPIGQLLAKTIPPDPLVWAKILMVRGGKES